MNRIRTFLTRIALAAAFIAVIGAALFAPVVQTWIAQAALSWHPELHGSVDAFSAAFGKVEIANLHLEAKGAALTVPSLNARLPVLTAMREKRFLFEELVAKGWTLDLTSASKTDGAREPGAGAADGGSASAAARAAVASAFDGALNRFTLGCDVSVEKADLEGDVLMRPVAGREPARFHVVLKGGGMSAGRIGDFALEVTGTDADLTFPIGAIAGHGHLLVTLKTPRIFDRIEVKGEGSVSGGSLAEPFPFATDAAVGRSAEGEAYDLDLIHGGRHLTTIAARFSSAKHALAGTWKVDLRQTDVSPFFPDRSFATMAIEGEGSFDADPAFTRTHGAGRLRVPVSRLGALAPPLERLGEVTNDITFDATQSGHSVHFDRIGLELASDHPVGEVHALQAFDIDEASGRIQLADAHADWLGISIRGLPLTWLAGLTDRFTLTEGQATGEFTLGSENGGYTVKSQSPLKASGVSVQIGAKMIGRALDFSSPVAAKWGPDGWEAQGESFTIASEGRTLATVKVKLTQPVGPETPIAVAGSASVDLESLAAQSTIPGLRWIVGRSVSGDFTASLGALSQVDATLALAGHDAGHSLTTAAHAEFDSYGGVTFYAPLKLALGSRDSELTIEGSRAPEETGARFDVKVRSKSIGVGDLRFVGGPLAAAGGASLPAIKTIDDLEKKSGSTAPDRAPFWGDWIGKVAFNFDRLKIAGHELIDVGGTVDVEHGSIRLTGGRAGLPKKGLVKADGSVSFDGAASESYSLKGSASVDPIDAARLFGAPTPKVDPLVEGHFSAAATLSGKGANFSDLAGNTQEEFQFKSTDGILRLLKTSVSGSFPEPSTPVKDTLGAVGSVFGSLMGVKHDGPAPGVVQHSKNTEAVISLTYQVAEFLCDQISVNGIRAPDGSIRFSEIAITAPEEHLTGTGSVSWVEGLPARSQAFSLDLQIAARSKTAELFSTAGLLSGKKDSLGYSILAEPVHFSGTVEHFDASQWHDLLVKAANRKPAEDKKPGADKTP